MADYINKEIPNSIEGKCTLPETNIAPENRPLERRFLFNTIIFRCYVSFGECKLIANSSCLTINPIFWRQKGRPKNLHIIAFSHVRRYQTSMKKKKHFLRNIISGCRFVPYIHTFSERSKKTDGTIQAGTHKCGDSRGLVQQHVMS